LSRSATFDHSLERAQQLVS